MSLHQFLGPPDARGPGLSGHLIGLALVIAVAVAVALPATWLWAGRPPGGTTGTFLMLGLATVATLAGAGAVLLIARRQGRRLASLTGPGFSAGSVGLGFVLFGALGAAFLGAAFWIDGTALVWRITPLRLVYAGCGLVAMLGIAAAEEVVFRAYLPQGLRNRMPAAIAALVTAIAFGLLHGLGEGWPGVAYRIVLALAMFAAIAATDNIGAAIGAHAANNVTALIMVPVDRPGSNLALIELPGTGGDTLDEAAVVMLALRCILFIVALQLWQRHCHKKLEITESPG